MREIMPEIQYTVPVTATQAAVKRAAVAMPAGFLLIIPGKLILPPCIALARNRPSFAAIQLFCAKAMHPEASVL